MSNKFDLGASAFVDGGKFLLRRADWKNARAYASAASKADPSSIPIEEVRTLVAGVQSDAKAWNAMTYPAVVSLASTVVDFGRNNVPTYVAALAKVLDGLGNDPKNEALSAKANAIFELLLTAVKSNGDAVSPVTDSLATFESQVAAAYRRIAPIVSAYVQIYRTSPSRDADLPSDLDAPVAALAHAWNELATTLQSLKDFVSEHVKDGKPFNVDITPNTAIAEWNTAASDADDFRTHAYVGTFVSV